MEKSAPKRELLQKCGNYYYYYYYYYYLLCGTESFLRS